MVRIQPTSLTLLLAASSLAAETSVDSIVDALSNGEASFLTRIRYETVSNDNDAQDDAHALTARFLLGYRTKSYRGFSAFLEMEATEHLFGDYNSTANGKTDYAVVADPDSAGINQGYLRYTDSEDRWHATLGRQILAWDNQRHVGHVGWRQNWQTYDALSAEFTPMEKLQVKAAYVYNVNTVVAKDTPMDSLLLNAGYKMPEVSNFGAYLYYLDYTRAADEGKDLLTIGAFIDGKRPISDKVTVSWRGEFAQQSDAGDNPVSYSASYMHAKVGASYGPVQADLGYEVLGSDDGTAAFKVPLGTNHAFNGWSDVLLGGAGNDGLQDIYAGVWWQIPHASKPKLGAVYHVFTGDDSGDDIGSEIDAQLTLQQPGIATLSYGAKAALFSADDDSSYVDTSKFWLWTQWSF